MVMMLELIIVTIVIKILASILSKGVCFSAAQLVNMFTHHQPEGGIGGGVNLCVQGGLTSADQSSAETRLGGRSPRVLQDYNTCRQQTVTKCPKSGSSGRAQLRAAANGRPVQVGWREEGP